jgi:hypothetical protein
MAGAYPRSMRRNIGVDRGRAGKENSVHDPAATVVIVIAALAVLALLVWFLRTQTPETLEEEDEWSGAMEDVDRPAGPDAERQIAPEFGAPDGDNDVLGQETHARSARR